MVRNRILAVAGLMVALTLLVIRVAPAVAQPTLTATPGAALPGARVTVSGSCPTEPEPAPAPAPPPARSGAGPLPRPPRGIPPPRLRLPPRRNPPPRLRLPPRRSPRLRRSPR